jgi:hypothetical protein
MTTLDTRMLADATEKIIAHLDNDLTIDSFLDQTVHAIEHGVGLTELGRLILDERIQMKPHN